jgi:hypothetical protein
MVLTIAVMLFAMAAAVILRAREAAKRRTYARAWASLAVAILLLAGAGYAVQIGISRPTALMPRADSNCTYGLGPGVDGCLPSPPLAH